MSASVGSCRDKVWRNNRVRDVVASLDTDGKWALDEDMFARLKAILDDPAIARTMSWEELNAIHSTYRTTPRLGVFVEPSSQDAQQRRRFSYLVRTSRPETGRRASCTCGGNSSYASGHTPNCPKFENPAAPTSLDAFRRGDPRAVNRGALYEPSACGSPVSVPTKKRETPATPADGQPDEQRDTDKVRRAEGRRHPKKIPPASAPPAGAEILVRRDASDSRSTCRVVVCRRERRDAPLRVRSLDGDFDGTRDFDHEEDWWDCWGVLAHYKKKIGELERQAKRDRDSRDTAVSCEQSARTALRELQREAAAAKADAEAAAAAAFKAMEAQAQRASQQSAVRAWDALRWKKRLDEIKRKTADIIENRVSWSVVKLKLEKEIKSGKERANTETRRADIETRRADSLRHQLASAQSTIDDLRAALDTTVVARDVAESQVAQLQVALQQLREQQAQQKERHAASLAESRVEFRELHSEFERSVESWKQIVVGHRNERQGLHDQLRRIELEKKDAEEATARLQHAIVLPETAGELEKRGFARVVRASSELGRPLPIKVDADVVRTLLMNAGLQIYDGKSSLNQITLDWLHSINDVEDFHDNIRRVLQQSPLWQFTHDRKCALNGSAPKLAVVQLDIERALFEFNKSWRFTQYTLSFAIPAKGISQRVNDFLNGTLHTFMSRDSLLRYLSAQLTTFLSRIQGNYTLDPRNTGAEFHDNYQQDDRGSIVTLGDGHRDRIAVGTDGVVVFFHNAPREGEDPMLLEVDARGRVTERAWDESINEEEILELMSKLPCTHFSRRLETEMGATLAYVIEPAGDQPQQKKAKKGEGVVAAHRKKDPFLNLLKAKAENFYESQPEQTGLRRSVGSFGLNKKRFQALGFTRHKTKPRQQRLEYQFYPHKLKVESKVDSDVWVPVRENYAAVLRTQLFRHTQDGGVCSDLVTRILCFVPPIPYKPRRLRFIGGDNETYPDIKLMIIADKLMSGNTFAYVHPVPAMWHAAKSLQKKMILGRSFGDTESPVAWAKTVLFDDFIRHFRRTREGDETEWGKVSTQYNFDDYYRVLRITYFAWLSVRATVFADIVGETGPAPDDYDLLLLLTYFDHDLPIVIYYLPSLKLDPETVELAILEMQRTAMRWHCTGYAKDLLQWLVDLQRMKPEVRRLTQENIPDINEVSVEYVHKTSAITEAHHTRSTVESINKQHACMEALNRGCTLLDLFSPSDKTIKATYSLPDVHTNQESIAHMATIITKRFTEAGASPKKCRVDHENICTTAFGGREVRYPKTMLLGCFNDAHHKLAVGTIEALKRENTLEPLLPRAELVVHLDDGPKAPNKLNTRELHFELLRRGVLECDLRDADGNDKGLGDLRKMLAPYLQSNFLWHATEEEHGDKGRLATMFRVAAENNLDFVGSIGAFCQYDNQSNDLEAEAPIDQVELVASEFLQDAVAPAGFEIVVEAPAVAMIGANDDGTPFLERHNDYRVLLGGCSKPTHLLIWFEGSLDYPRRRGWFHGIVANKRGSIWHGFCSGKKQLEAGCNYRISWKARLTNGVIEDGIETICLSPEYYSRTPKPGMPNRTWVMLRPIE